MGMIKSLAFAAVIGAATAIGAQAATITVDNTPDLNALKPTSTSLQAGATWDSAPYTGVGSAGSLFKSPYADAVTEYFFVEGKENDASLPVNSPAVLLLNSVRTAFSMLWGSPDSYNNLKFYLGGVEVASFNGQTNVNGGSPVNNGPTAFVSISGFKFDSVAFYSDGKNAFEFGNIAAVPLPAGGILLITAIGGLAAARRRKQA